MVSLANLPEAPAVELPEPYAGQIFGIAPGVTGQIRGRVTMMVMMLPPTD